MYLFTFQNHYQNKERYILSKITMDCRNEVFFQTQKMRIKGFGSSRPAKNHGQDRLYANFDLEKAF